MTTNNTIEKFTTAIEGLVTHPGTPQDSLWNAWVTLHPLQEGDFPRQLQEYWCRTWEGVANLGSCAMADSLENQVSGMGEHDCQIVRKRIWALYRGLLNEANSC